MFFYFFGHAVAEGISRYVFLVPEGTDSTGPPPKDVIELDKRLIEIGWLRERLAAVSNQVIVMIDSCRSHARGGAISDLLEKCLQTGFAMGFRCLQDNTAHGKSTEQSFVLYSSEDGTPTSPVPYKINETSNRIGPVSARFDMLIREITSNSETLTAAAFVDRMRSPAKLPDGVSVRSTPISTILKV